MSAQQLEQIEQLQATLSKMELTLSAIADAVVWVGADEVVQWCNSSFERLLNRPKSEILRSRFSELLPLWQAENPVKLELYPHTRIHQGNYTPTEYELRQTENSLVLHISGTLADITSEKSAILIIKDITQQKDKSLEIIERKRAEEALHCSNAILKAQQEAAVDGILIIDENRKVISYNQRFVELWQIPAAVIQTEDDSQLLASVIHQLEDPEEFLAKIEYLYQHPEEISRDEISLKAGKVFDRYSAPVSSSLENYFGRIWYFRDITERRLAEEALQASEARLNTILSSALAAIYLIRVYANYEWHFEYCSPGTLQIWGFTPEELIADKNLLISRTVPEDLENVLQKGFAATFGEQVCDIVYRYLHPDGSLRWITFKLISARDEATDSWLATVISTDVTNQKRAEEALKASEARLNTILNSALAVIFYARLYPNREWDIEYCSPGSLEIWGYTPEQIIADKNLYLSNIFPEDLENVYQPALDACLAEQNYETEYRYLHPDGSLRWNFFNLTSVQDKAAGCWRATIVSTDITNQKRAEEALKASEARLNTILNSASAAIYYFRVYPNREWHFEYCSPRSLEIWGYTPEQLIADKNIYFSRILPEDMEKFNLPAIDAIMSEQYFECEYRYLHPDGSLRWIFCTLTSVRDEASDCWRATVVSTDITEKKCAEEALKASEARLNTILNGAQAAIYVNRVYPNREWHFEYCSAGSLELWGFTPEELIADKNLFMSRMLPEDLETCVKKAFDALITGQPCEIEYRYLHPNGSLRWFSLKLTSVRDEVTDSWLATVISTDITNQKRAEEALKASETKLNTILNSVLGTISLIRVYPNSEWHFEYCSPGSTEFWGLTPEELIKDKNLKISRIVPEDLDKAFKKGLDAIFAEQTYEAEYRYLHPDGSLRWMYYSATSVKDLTTNSWLATLISTDITERKRAEQVQQHRAQAENILSNISRYFLDQNLDTAINFTLEAIAQFINAERSCIYTYSENQQECYLLYEWCAGGIEPMAEITRSITVEKFPGIHQQMFQGKAVQFASKTEISQNTTELKILTASAIKSVMIVPMMHTNTVVGLLCFNTVSKSKTWSQEDINFLKLVGELIAMGRARHEAEAALTLAKEAAEAANRAKSMFLANMSHELRTPLNAILGFAQLMERDRTLNPKQQESLATINRSGEHLLNLIDDVLEMSKIEAGRVVLHPETFDLLALLRIIQEMFLVRTQAKQLFLKFEIAADVPRYINTDEGKLRQVLINLLGNAVKFTTNGGITLRVKGDGEKKTTSQEETNSTVYSIYFEIEDTGCGIAPEEMKNLFKPFVQTSSGIHLKSGTGLGLTISREFIRLMGGEIHARSIFGQGSSFSFNIQVNVSASFQAAIQLNSRRVVQLAANHSSVRILVVDDIPENCDLIAQLLSSTGFAVQIAVNGKQAISQWQAWQPHLIFMDMRMPVMDGYEATRVIRAREREIQHHNNSVPDPRTIIIALTASAFEEQRATIIAAGCDDLVRKPFKEQVIFDKIAEYLNVNYIYADEPSNYSETQDLLMNQGRNNKITSGDLAKIMPQEWLLQLRQAALEVDGDRILQLISEIPSIYADSANELIRLVRQFCFDEILELAELNTRC